MRMLEASADGSTFKVLVIRSGLTADGKRNYKREALREAAERGVYSNVKMFANHPGPDDKDLQSRGGAL